MPTTDERRERLTPEHRLTTSRQHAAVREAGVAYRGRYCLVLALARPGEPTRFGFIASRRSVGGAVQRNRARRRLRELVRRRWPRLSEHGHWVEFIALRGGADRAAPGPGDRGGAPARAGRACSRPAHLREPLGDA